MHQSFACCSAEGDFLYWEELQAFLAAGLLAGVRVICSCDQPEQLLSYTSSDSRPRSSGSGCSMCGNSVRLHALSTR